MQRLLAGFVIALGCHVLLLMVPIRHHQANQSHHPRSDGITVGFSRIEPITPQNEVKFIPLPPEPILPLKERIEKKQPKIITPPKPKRKSIPKSRPPKKKPAPPVSMPKHRPATAKAEAPQLPKMKPSPLPPKDEQRKPPRVEQPESPDRVIQSNTGKETRLSPATAAAPVQMTAKHKPSPQVSRAYPENKGNPPPKYPVLARRRGWQGTVKLSVLVLENGKVGDITIAKSSGYPLLDETALKAVARYRFVPGRQGDQPVTMRVEVPVHFRLKDIK